MRGYCSSDAKLRLYSALSDPSKTAASACFYDQIFRVVVPRVCPPVGASRHCRQTASPPPIETARVDVMATFPNQTSNYEYA